MRKKFLNKLTKLLSVSVGILMLSAAFVGCSQQAGDQTEPNDASKSASPNTSAKDITIGVMVPLSGSEAYYGKDMLQSYQLACDEINAAGGVLGRNLTLYQADDANDPNVATQAASKIIAKGVDFVVGGYGSGSTIPALQQYYDAELMMLISCANSTEITKLDLEQSFMINSPGTHAVDKLIELLEFLDSKRVALIHQGDAYTKDLSDICEEVLPQNNIEIATVQVMEKGSADVSAIVTAIRNANADFVYWCGYHADGGNVIKQLRQGGYTGDIAVGDGSASVELITASGPAGDGVYVTSPPFVEFSKGGEKFISDYTAKFNMPPGTYASLCYDTIYMLKNAIEEVGSTDFAKVRDAVSAIEYEGLSGLIKFAPNRELLVSNFIILQIENGEFKLVTL